MTGPARPSPDAGSFHDEFETTVADLRGAFIELLSTIPDLPQRPLQVSRFLGLDKNLGWKLAHMTRATDPAEAVRHLPGAAGLKRVLEACDGRGAGATELRAVRAAIVRFEGMVDRHTGVRQTLDLLLASGAPERQDATRMEQSRKLAFQGNGAICGVQARVRFGVQIVAPSSRSADWLDHVALGGLVELRRLRPTAAWPLMSVSSYLEDPNEPGGDRLLPRMNDLPLLHEFSSDPLPPIRIVTEVGRHVIELAEGPVGGTAASTVAFEWTTRDLGSVIGSSDDDVAELMLLSETPAEMLSFELLVHRAVPFVGAPSLSAFSAMHGRPRYPLFRYGRYRLPLCEQLEDLGARPPRLAHPNLARHGELIASACERAGWDLADFRGYRLVIRYPPIPSVIAMSYPLLPPR